MLFMPTKGIAHQKPINKITADPNKTYDTWLVKKKTRPVSIINNVYTQIKIIELFINMP